MQKRSPAAFILVFFIAISLACNLPMITNTGTTTGTPTTLALSPTPATPSTTNTSTKPAETPTLTATSTVTPVPPTSTNTAVVIPCNRAQYISDVNYPDDTTVLINTTFTKTWRIKNTGSCTWTSGYKIIFDSGDRMGAPDETTLTGGTVPPDATVDVSVQLKAPGAIGSYRGDYRFRSPDNIVFGIGASGMETCWVQIKTDALHIVVPLVPIHINSPTPTPIILHIFPKITLKFP
jgi:hypothetical protein